MKVSRRDRQCDDMKCTVCREKAVIATPSHNSAFCRTHFIAHVHRHIERAIEEHAMFGRDDRIAAAVSGGKDSMGMWKALTDMGYAVTAVHLDGGIGEFSQRSEEAVRAFGDAHGLPYHIRRIGDLISCDFERAVRIARKPHCSVCGTLRRYYLNAAARELGADVIVTGHNLDDEAARLLGNLLHWRTGYFDGQRPVLEAKDGLLKRAKPLIYVHEEEMAAYARICGIGIADDVCPHAVKATRTFNREIIGMIEETSPGTMAAFVSGALQHLQALSNGASGVGDEKQLSDRRCPLCGYRTLGPELCFVCSLRERIQESLTAGKAGR